MSDCERYTEMISRLADSELSEPEKTELLAHLETCPDCRRVYDAFEFISSSIDEGIEPPKSLCAEVMNAVRTTSIQAQSAKKRTRTWGRLTALAACLAIVVFAASKTGVFTKNSSADSGAAPARAAYQNDQADAEVSSDSSTEETTMYLQATSTSAPSNIESASDEPEPEPEPDAAAGSNGLTAMLTGGYAEEVSEVRLFSGTTTVASSSGKDNAAQPEPIAVFTDEDSITLIMEMLAFYESGDDLRVTGSPAFIAYVDCADGESYTLSLWIVDGLLCCEDSRDGTLYIAAGTMDDLIDFIAEA